MSRMAPRLSPRACRRRRRANVRYARRAWKLWGCSTLAPCASLTAGRRRCHAPHVAIVGQRGLKSVERFARLLVLRCPILLGLWQVHILTLPALVAPGWAQSFMFESILLGMGWDGMGWDGMGWDGLACPGLAWPGLPVPCLASPGLALAWPWPGLAWPWPGLGLAWPGLAWPGLAWSCLAWPWPGLAWPGLAWPWPALPTPRLPIIPPLGM